MPEIEASTEFEIGWRPGCSKRCSVEYSTIVIEASIRRSTMSTTQQMNNGLNTTTAETLNNKRNRQVSEKKKHGKC